MQFRCRNDVDLEPREPKFGNQSGLSQSDTIRASDIWRCRQYWVIPPEQDAEFVACMEDVLETYTQAYDPKCPVICMDEQPVQLIKETRKPIAATKKRTKRVDYEYERNGTASIFMFAEPLSGYRRAGARKRRTKID